MTPRGPVQTPPPSPPTHGLNATRHGATAMTLTSPESGAGTEDSWLTAWELTATGGVMLRTRLLPVQAQNNEELVCLQVDADTGDLRLVDMFLNLELFLVLAIGQWTACVTH